MVTELTKEILDKMVFHSTRGGLRRSHSTENMTMQSQTESTPTLYQVEGEDKDCVHVINSEVLMYLLSKQISE